MANEESAKTTKTIELEKPTTKLVDLANEADSMTLESGKSFLHLQRVAAMFAASSLVPETFKGNVPNCSIAINLAHRLGADELMVLQNLYVVHGHPGWSAKFKIAMFNQTGRFTPVKYRFTGTKNTDSWGCIAFCTERESNELIEGPEVTIKIAKDEGWYGRMSRDGKERASKWPTMPELMLRYRSASWMIDTTAPELTMGLKTVEELEDAGPELLEKVVARTEELKIAKNQSKLDALVPADKVATDDPNLPTHPRRGPGRQKKPDVVSLAPTAAQEAPTDWTSQELPAKEPQFSGEPQLMHAPTDRISPEVRAEILRYLNDKGIGFNVFTDLLGRHGFETVGQITYGAVKAITDELDQIVGAKKA